MPNYSIASEDLEVAVRAALFGPRKERLRLLNIVRELNEQTEDVNHLVNVGNPSPGERDNAYNNLSTAVPA